jgi:hypothetical protein
MSVLQKLSMAAMAAIASTLIAAGNNNATAVVVEAVNDGGDGDSHDGGIPAQQATIS